MNSQLFASATDASHWVCSSNEAVRLHLIGNAEELKDKDNNEGVFEPRFTYPIFGQEEQIFGYEGLQINFYFSASSLYLYVDINYKKKLDASIGEADDIDKLLEDFLPESNVYTRDETRFKEELAKDARSFQPIGNLVHTYNLDQSESNETFEIYSTRWDTAEASDLCMRTRLLPVLYIEGAQFIEEDPRWEIVTLQFLILPPYQGEGHGFEDPNEEFSDLRDKNDLRRLVNDPTLNQLEAPVTSTVINKLATEHKLNKRQTERCVEMALLRRLSTRDENRFKPYRLQVKRRLFQFNKDALVQLDKPERLQKLHETFESVLEDYQRILDLSKLNSTAE
ncbi:acyl-CoA N-acyltransferase [Syncephalis plumigaleata]|nr:acyl-CoA N-acyltransferase [Syncephalis plumigaleata]